MVNIIENTYAHTAAIIDNCFDDHQWWLLAWVRAYQLTKNLSYIQRAATIFDDTVAHAWTAQCGGGVIWCPTSTYKNAITNELFFTSAMSLHPYTSILGRPANFYLNWAIKEWDWFIGTGMLNNQGLINDGLTNDCKNNGQTTWTYNQGVLLNGLTMLYSATNNVTYVQTASKIIQAVFNHLTVNNILNEPCSNCDSDQLIFKGIFLRHLGYSVANTSVTPHLPNLDTFFINNANSLIEKAVCTDGSYGSLWQGPCKNQNVASESSALDLLMSAGEYAKNQPPSWHPIGLGNCEDDQMQSMPNCYRTGVTEAQCRSQAQNDAKAVAYDLSTSCTGQTSCRVRTLGGASACPSGWSWTGGSATTVTTTNGNDLTLCVLKS